MTVPRSNAILGRSVKLLLFSVRTYSRQFTEPSLFSAPKISFGNGTTTFSTFFDIALTSIRWGACAPWAPNVTPIRAIALNFKDLEKAVVGTYHCSFLLCIQG